MSDYNWTCPCCDSAVYWGDEAYYSEELDDKICAECYNIDQTERLTRNSQCLNEDLDKDK